MIYKLLPKQKQFLEIPHQYSLDVALYQGGFGSGKTFCGALLGILLMVKYPNIIGLVGALTYPLVRDTTLQTYLEHLQNMGFEEKIDYNFSKTEQKLIFKNGSKALFRNFEDPSKLKSLNLGFVQIEEMSDIPKSTFLMVLGRLRQSIKPYWQNFRYRLFGHTNPEQHKGWIYHYFVENKKPNYRLIIAPTYENTYLPKDFVENLKTTYDKKYYNLNVLGNFCEDIDNLVVKDFSKDNVKNLNYDPDLDLHLSCDFNVDPMSWVIAHKTDDKVFFIDEIVLENTTTAKCMDEFISRYKSHKGKIIINGDASGDNRTVNSEFTNYVIMKKKLLNANFDNIDIHIRSFNPPINNRIAAFNCKVCDFSGQRKLFIDPKCEKLLYNIYNLKYKVGSSIIDLPGHWQIKRNNELKFLSHIFDAASYLVEYYFPISF